MTIAVWDGLLVQAAVDAASGSDSEYEDDKSVVVCLVDEAVAADADAPPPGKPANVTEPGGRGSTPRAVTASRTRLRTVGSSRRISLRAEGFQSIAELTR